MFVGCMRILCNWPRNPADLPSPCGACASCSELTSCHASRTLPTRALYLRRLWTARPLPRNETVFDRAEDRGSVIGVELRFGLMEEPNVERYLADIARHKEIDQRRPIRGNGLSMSPTRTCFPPSA